MLQRVLIPTDFSPASAEALRIARQFCAGATKRLLYVLRPGDLDELTVRSPVEAQSTRRKAEDAAMERLRSWALEGDEVAVEIGSSPAEDILRHARAWGADMIVIGTRGRSGISSFLSGSATEWLVRHGKMPVLAVHDVEIEPDRACRVPDQ